MYLNVISNNIVNWCMVVCAEHSCDKSEVRLLERAGNIAIQKRSMNHKSNPLRPWTEWSNWYWPVHNSLHHDDMELTLLELTEALTLTLIVMVIWLPCMQMLEGAGEGQRDGHCGKHRLVRINSRCCLCNVGGDGQVAFWNWAQQDKVVVIQWSLP